MHYLGQDEPVYYSGGSAVILTHEAMKRLGDRTLRNEDIWSKPEYGSTDDVRITQVLAKVGVSTVDTRTDTGKHQFLALGISGERSLETPAAPSLLRLRNFSRDAVTGPQCCSPRWIGSHYAEDYGKRWES
jgi:hypothetical protein